MGAAGSPSARIVAEATALSSVTDALGRVLEVRRPGALDRLRLFKAVGPGLSLNDQYLGYAMLAMCVASVDGVPVPQPANEGQVEALVGRLGDAGMVAVGQALSAADRTEGGADGGAGGGSAGGEVAGAGPGNGGARPDSGIRPRCGPTRRRGSCGMGCSW